ncbi:hypothetical protein D9M70_601620 [compost metagenome]
MAKALNKLGVPSARDIETLMERIDELNRHVQRLSTKAPAAKAARKAAPAKAATPAPRKTAVRKTAVKSKA